MKLSELKDKKILILGFGREGLDSFLFFKKLFPKNVFGISDKTELEKLNPKTKTILKRAKNVNLHLGLNYLKVLDNYDVIIKTPGISIHLPEIEKAFKENKVTSQTEIFFENCPGKIIGITGTKGKSTTTSLIYKVLKDNKIRAFIVGNIGKPVLSLLSKAKKEDVFVFELSSHQLYNLKKSPHIAVFLNIYPEHLDYYKDFEEYFRAKQNITLNQNKTDYFIFNNSEKLVLELSKKTKAGPISFSESRGDCKIEENFIIYHGEKIIKLEEVPLKGMFNYLNTMPAIIIGKLFNIPSQNIVKSIKTFIPLEHRLELVGTFKGISFYNDALATIPQATIGAIEALGSDVQTIMLGGFNRNIEFLELAKKVLESNIRTVILFPTTGELIWKEIVKRARGKTLPKSFPANSMQEAVKIAYENTLRGKICLMSCASSSFSIFKDYKEKGDLFKKFVKQYGRK